MEALLWAVRFDLGSHNPLVFGGFIALQDESNLSFLPGQSCCQIVRPNSGTRFPTPKAALNTYYMPEQHAYYSVAADRNIHERTYLCRRFSTCVHCNRHDQRLTAPCPLPAAPNKILHGFCEHICTACFVFTKKSSRIYCYLHTLTQYW